MESQEQQINPKWLRPPPRVLDSSKDKLVFQQIDIDHYTGNVDFGS